MSGGEVDWKEVADSLFMFIAGMVSANAEIHGKSVESAMERAMKMRAEIIEENTEPEHACGSWPYLHEGTCAGCDWRAERAQ